LLAQDRAIVTDIPGTTRDVLEERVHVNGLPMILMDTAGLRETTDVVEREGTERTRRALERADLAVLVIDGSERLNEQDLAIARSITDRPRLVALNKSDAGVVTEANAVAEATRSQPVIAVSARIGTGMDRLMRAMADQIKAKAPLADSSPIVTNERH